MAHTLYNNVVIQDKISDLLNSHLDLMRFATVDDSLVGVEGDTVKVHKYTATSGTEALEMGEGNSKDIDVSFTPVEYKVLCYQNRFKFYDEEVMKDKNVLDVGCKAIAADLYNTTNGGLYGEYLKTTQKVTVAQFDFAAFSDAVAKLNIENMEGVEVFAFINSDDTSELRKNLKDDLKYIEGFVRSGYIGTVCGVNVYTKKDATAGKIAVGMKQAVTYFLKKGVESEAIRDTETANVRQTVMFTRKYGFPALTDETKAVVIEKEAVEPEPDASGEEDNA